MDEGRAIKSLPSTHDALYITLNVAFCNRLALIVKLPTTTQAKFYLRLAVFQVELERDKRQALRGNPGQELIYLLLVKQ